VLNNKYLVNAAPTYVRIAMMIKYLYLFLVLIGNSALKDKEDQFGRTPLMYCVLADRLDCADALLKAGAVVNKTDHSQRTALHLAAQKVRSKITLMRKHLCGIC
jgi:ankyrin repeat protein